MRKVFIDDLPKWGKLGNGKEGTINWSSINNQQVEFIYDNINGVLTLVRFNKITNKIIVQYNKNQYEVHIGQIIKCQIGGIIKRNQLNINEYKNMIIKFKKQNTQQNNIRKIFLNILPMQTLNSISWEKSGGYNLYFIYDDIEGWLKIVEYNKNTQKLSVEYNKNKFEIKYGDFARCNLGKILGKITSDFKLEIGQKLKDEKRDITITDKKKIPRYNKDGSIKCYDKYYKYKCNKCGFDCGEHWNIRDKEYKDEYWVVESSLFRGGGCSCCCSSPQIVIENINSIYKTDAWMIPIINDDEFCKTHTHSCSDKIFPTCPDCGRISERQYTINSIYSNHKVICTCGDGFPYTEKVMFSVLKQLKNKFVIQLGRKNFSWCGKYKYDFYFKLNGEQYIIETHGQQHYRDNTNFKMKLIEVQENDKIKKELALQNGIKEKNYIVVDCRKSELKWINKSILESRLAELFDLSNINWDECENFATSNLVKEVCEYKNNNYLLSSEEIGDIFNLNKTTVSKYLKIGNKLNWCIYDIDFEKQKGRLKAGKKRYKPLIDLNTFYIFKSIKSCVELSKNVFGIQLTYSGIVGVCSGIYNSTNGCKFKRIKDLTPEEYIKYDIENKLKELHNRELVQAC